MAGVFDLGDSSNAGVVILKALDFADESLQEVLSIAEGKSDGLRNETISAAEGSVGTAQ